MGKAYKIYGHRAQRVKLRTLRLAAQQQAIDEQWAVFEEMMESGELNGCNGVIYVSSEEEIPAALDTFFAHLTKQSQNTTQASLEDER